MKTVFEIKRNKGGEFSWHAKRGGRIVCDSGETYKRKVTMILSLSRFICSIREGDYEFPDERNQTDSTESVGDLVQSRK